MFGNRRSIRYSLLRIGFSIFMIFVLAPGVFLLSRQLMQAQITLPYRIILHVLSAVVFVFVYSFLYELLLRELDFPKWQINMRGFRALQAKSLITHPLRLFFRNFNFSFFGYWFVVGATYALTYYAKFQERELQATKLTAQLATAQLDALRGQLQPHFLFNTLHTLSSLIYEDVKAADKMIRQLSDFLRLTLKTGDVQQVTLQQELQFLNLYFDIMQTRFQDRLKVKITIPGEMMRVVVPNLILQPLAENAIKHGVEKIEGTGIITIIGEQLGGSILLTISDNGPGPTEAGHNLEGAGVGLRNTRERLQQLYGEQHSLLLVKNSSGGATVRLTLPLSYERDSADGKR